MRQALALLVGAALLVVAALAVPTPDDVEPDVAAPVYPGAATDVGFCPTWTADAEVSSALVFGAIDGIAADVGFQADDETVDVPVERQGAGTTSADPGLAQGYVPALAETIDGDPIAGGVVTTGPSVAAASGCARWPAERWTVGVGGTLENEESTLILHNPTVQAATVSVEVYSEQGLEIGEGFGSITVPPQGSIQREITGDLRLRERIVFVVSDPTGAVVPALDHRNEGGDRGVTTGVPEAPEWYLPATGGLEGELALVNSGTFEVAVEVDVYGPQGVEVGAEALLLPARSVEFIPVAAGTALRVRADASVGAALRTEQGPALAVAMGVETESTSWMLPGLGSGGGEAVMSILNTGTEPLDVTYRVLGPGGATAGRTITVPASAVFHQRLEVSNAAGIHLEAAEPFTVGWSSTAANGALALDQGIPRG